MSIDQRIREGLRDTRDALPMPDVDRALAAVTADARRTHRRALLVGLAAAVIAVVVGGLAIVGDGNDSQRPVNTPSVNHESPGSDDHPISLYDGDGALMLVTRDGSDRVGTATLWRKDPGGWQRLGTLEHAVLPEGVAGRTHLSRGPGTQDLVALGLDDDRVGFSRDGGATWSYLARPAECAERSCSAIFATSDYLYVNVDGGAAVRAAFGATAWEDVTLPSGPESPERNVVLLVLDDVLLTIDSDCDTTTNHYWVSEDHGDTWSRRRNFPVSTCTYSQLGNTAYAADPRETQWWRSTDLVSWEQAPTSPHDERARLTAACPGSLGKDPSADRLDEPPLRIGAEVYKIFHLSSRSDELELKVSHDRCQTWRPVLP